ncbi:MAG TPA: helix-turn-helix domain-containing protein [Acidimicrobiales bacterium]|nr:helix-turn-helix domain-containing protein [Acidimicrobiales bacterium]
MSRVTNAASGPAGGKPSPRRSALLQTRSRNTRRRLIRAALEIWNERGFEDAFEETTAEDIARAAGVSKGTFYFHFAHKEDILLEMPWATAEIMVEEADGAIGRGVPAFDVVEQLMTSLAGRVSRAPRGAVLRVTGQWSRLSHTGSRPEDAKSFGEAFQRVVRYAVDSGELPAAVDVAELGVLLQAVTMDALVAWAATDQSAAALRRGLCRRADVVLRGAAVSYGR